MIEAGLSMGQTVIGYADPPSLMLLPFWQDAQAQLLLSDILFTPEIQDGSSESLSPIAI